ncbi:zinc finger protein [Trypanosoma rangeli]|uniref:Zinc finger protein n=1 Tax=Trypanosoma rangeli TaxID=5698 RepID=A0A422MYB5_TRYRA|nr:zinc finger protein [Trypanosoma rangeli]RNE98169.1 zinc finger protein [Trypanosoma rangeli]|eukprot:RNE98169.1 zinc finger protein [Trypanosoma rangeli]
MRLASWKPDSASQQCDSCAKKFEFFRRRHHCRLCGGIFCYSCSDVFLPGELILLRWLEINGYEKASKKAAATDTTTSEKLLDMFLERHFLTKSGLSNFFPPAPKTAPQRVCVRCFDDVESHAYAHKPTLSWRTHSNPLSDTLRSGAPSINWRTASDRRESLVGGRERKVCVILLKGSGGVESGERTDLRELFHALGQLTIQAKAESTHGNSSSKETTPSLSPSLSSASDLSGSEKNLLSVSMGGRTATETTGIGQQGLRGRFSATSTTTKYRKKIALQVPMSLDTSDPTHLSPGTTAPSLSVRVQLIGVTHRHGFDKALLQQHTIGTDAYIILLDGEPISPLDTPAFSGVSSGFGNGNALSCTTSQSGNSVPSPTISIFPRSLDMLQEPSLEAVPPAIGASYGDSFSGKLVESARAVWEAIGRYGGDIPICAVIDCASCIGAGNTELGAFSAVPGNSTSQMGAGMNLRCQSDKQQKSVSVEGQAAALHKALLLLTNEVIRRDVMRRKY